MLLKLKNIGKIYNSNDILTIGIRNINLEFDYIQLRANQEVESQPF